MKISINQPAYLPWLGYFDRIAKSDLFVVLDHVQFEKNSMINRNKMRSGQHWCWLTVPVNTSKKFGNLPINQVNINNNNRWQKKHWDTLYFNYKKAPYFNLYADKLAYFYENEWTNLSQALTWQLKFFLTALKINTPIEYSSKYNYQTTKSDLVLDICQNHQANIYLSGHFGKDYLEQDKFSKESIEVEFQDYQHPTYQQLSSPFISHLSTLDLLFHHGSDSLSLLTNQKVI